MHGYHQIIFTLLHIMRFRFLVFIKAVVIFITIAFLLSNSSTSFFQLLPFRYLSQPAMQHFQQKRNLHFSLSFARWDNNLHFIPII